MTEQVSDSSDKDDLYKDYESDEDEPEPMDDFLAGKENNDELLELGEADGGDDIDETTMDVDHDSDADTADHDDFRKDLSGRLADVEVDFAASYSNAVGNSFVTQAIEGLRAATKLDDAQGFEPSYSLLNAAIKSLESHEELRDALARRDEEE